MPAEADACGNVETDIATDRPDVTNSSQVVPRASVQVENGINWTTQQRETVIDGSNSRVRFGVAQCTEVLFDLRIISVRYATQLRQGFPTSRLR